MVTRLIATGLAIALLGLPAFTVAADSRAHSLADLAWMTGHWVMEDGDGRAEEIWTAPLDGSMVASFRWAVPGRMHVLEFLVIEERDNGVYFRFKHFNRDYGAWEATPNTYRLVRVEQRTATFENVD